MGAAGAPGPVGPPGPPGPDATSDFRVQAGIPQCYLPEQGLWVDLCVEPEVWRGGIIRSTFPNESGPAETPSNFPLGEQFFGVSFEHFWGYDPNEPPWRGLPACILNWMGTPEGPGTVTDYIQALFFEKPDGTFLEVRRDSSWTFVADGIHTNMVGLSCQITSSLLMHSSGAAMKNNGFWTGAVIPMWCSTRCRSYQGLASHLQDPSLGNS
jgi:hypothetical protein